MFPSQFELKFDNQLLSEMRRPVVLDTVTKFLLKPKIHLAGPAGKISYNMRRLFYSRC